jgi:hypothetical protein
MAGVAELPPIPLTSPPEQKPLPAPVKLSTGCVRWCWAEVQLALGSLSADKVTEARNDPFLMGVRNATSAA